MEFILGKVMGTVIPAYQK